MTHFNQLIQIFVEINTASHAIPCCAVQASDNHDPEMYMDVYHETQKYRVDGSCRLKDTMGLVSYFLVL